MKDEGKETHKFHCPSKDGSLEVFIVGQWTSFEDLDGFDDGEATVELASDDVVIEDLGFRFGYSSRCQNIACETHLGVPFYSVWRDASDGELREKFLTDDIEGAQESLAC